MLQFPDPPRGDEGLERAGRATLFSAPAASDDEVPPEALHPGITAFMRVGCKMLARRSMDGRDVGTGAMEIDWNAPLELGVCMGLLHARSGIFCQGRHLMEQLDISAVLEHDDATIEIEGDLELVDYSRSLPPVAGPILESASLPGFEGA